MANEQNLKPKPFTSENQPPAESKSRKGIPNRATVYKKFLALRETVPHPTDAAKELKITLYEAAALGQLLAAREGNTQAWKEIQDSLHGSHTVKVGGADGGAIQHRVIFEAIDGGNTDEDSDE